MKILVILLIMSIPNLLLAQISENPFLQNKFNPDLSIIADFAFNSSDIRDESREKLEIPEFLHHHPHSHISKARGINFNYLELAFSAPIDVYFDFTGITTLAPGHGIEIEEVYADTRFLPYGFGARTGLFKSGIGRHNSKHIHNWDFYDSPVIYDAILGSEGISDVGLRLTYTFPLDFFLQLGGEIFQGNSGEPISFNAKGFTFLGHEIKDASVPSLFTGYLKTSFDFGEHIFLLGSSVLYGHSNLSQSGHTHKQNEEISEHKQENAINAPGTIVFGFDLTYKYIIDAHRYLSVESEYLSRIIDGTIYIADDNETEEITDDFAIKRKIHKTNSGLYVQALFKFDKRWRTGLRLDYLIEPHVELDGQHPEHEHSEERLYKISYMIDYNFTEFSKIRFQYNYDHTKYFEERMLPIQEFILNLNFAVGAHGAHSF
ncbi:MAG: hypothetical protein N2746_01335 [Deltaproteobacteria bacterium]|nr:hypothetical protein [Deltaproteobacteria bacterium]